MEPPPSLVLAFLLFTGMTFCFYRCGLFGFAGALGFSLCRLLDASRFLFGEYRSALCRPNVRIGDARVKSFSIGGIAFKPCL